MSDAPEIPADPMSALFLSNPPETADDMRSLLDGFADMLNGELPPVGAFHERVPVAIFLETMPDFPIPVTTTRPWQLANNSTARSKVSSSRGIRLAMASASIWRTLRPVS